ncbi:MAG: threonine ammonia-lyase [Deinococcaceae bacterium]
MTIQLEDIQKAERILQGVSLKTPTLKDPQLSLELGARVWVKAECLQRSGSFKVRGAYTKICSLSPEEKSKGVVAPSAGNHAQGVALAAQLHGIHSTIVMPTFAPLTKVVATKGYGAEVILHGQSFDDAAAYVRQLQQERGLIPVHAFDDPLVIAGQGTLGLEILDALPDVDTIVVPIGGGGLISGVATAVKALHPKVRMVGVQATGCASVRPSLLAGHPIAVSAAQTIADGIAVKRPGDLTLPIIREKVDQVVEVTDDEIARGIVHCAQRLKLVVEGAGAAGIAALLAGKIDIRPQEKVCVVLCGGNIDGTLLSRVIEQVMAKQGRYMLLRLAIADRPGALAPLISSVAEVGANIIDIFHLRAAWLAPLGKVGIELLLEVRDSLHGDGVVAHLQQSGYHVEREKQGYWPE